MRGPYYNYNIMHNVSGSAICMVHIGVPEQAPGLTSSPGSPHLSVFHKKHSVCNIEKQGMGLETRLHSRMLRIVKAIILQ